MPIGLHTHRNGSASCEGGRPCTYESLYFSLSTYTVPCATPHPYPAPFARAQRMTAPHGGSKMGNAVKMLRAVKTKANGSGRTYTSKYRGVHQTFPTKRWEAQFRRNGKPTSLGELWGVVPPFPQPGHAGNNFSHAGYDSTASTSVLLPCHITL